jgi:hypothetical protein
VPAGSLVYAWWFADRNQWEPLAFGKSICESGSESPSESPSESESESPSQSESETSGSEKSTAGSEKSTAIVPASWTKGGYTAWHVEESPNVRFNDYTFAANLTAAETHVPIDLHYLEGCEPGTIKVFASPEAAVVFGASIVGNQIRVRMRFFNPSEPVAFNFHLTAIRRGFLGVRFPDKTRADFEANEQFLKGAFVDGQ